MRQGLWFLADQMVLMKYPNSIYQNKKNKLNETRIDS